MMQIPMIMKPKAVLGLIFVGIVSLLAGCAWIPTKPGVYQPGKDPEHYTLDKNLVPGEFFTPELKTGAKTFADADQIQHASEKIDTTYLFGPGDSFDFLVRGRPDISQLGIIVSPDGEVSLPRVGIVNVKGKTLHNLTDLAVKVLSTYYEKPEVTIVMKAYNNNRVFVLGRVANPGAVKFQGPGTLLEALSLCGGMPTDPNQTFLSRCSITRGKDLVMWIDLRELLERGNMNLNAQLQNGDVIYIPLPDEQNAYILGEVKSPGIIALRTQESIMNAIMTAGGPTKGADLKSVFLIHRINNKGFVEKINVQELISRGDSSKNYILRDGDMIYVPETGLTRINYFCAQLQPFFTIIGVTINAVTGIGSLNYLLYGGTSIVHP